ncbi:MAG: PBP1A family penicillin-binding protein [Nitrospinae bacterium]|nr:PBP1A family penicillin-binding protein [Nitrospinota bacterium]
MWKITFWGFLTCLLLGFTGAGILYFKYSDGLPDVRALKNYQPNIITKVYSDQDELIAEFFIEKRILVPFDAIPLRLKQATLAVEDSGFYYHPGVDPKAIIRASIANFKAGHVVEGASTITQQLTKILYLSPQKKLERKIREAILAIRIELIFTKDEIFEMYLNQIYYGHGSYGVGAASRTYFGKELKDLTIAECAMIASLPKAPTHYSPYNNLDKALKRRDHALRRMKHDGFITKEEYEAALTEPLELGGVKGMLNKAPYFVEYIRQFIQKNYGSQKLYRDGMKIFTTLNLDNQISADRAVKMGLRRADKRYGYRGPLGQIDLNQDLEVLNTLLMELNKRPTDRNPRTREPDETAVDAQVATADPNQATAEPLVVATDPVDLLPPILFREGDLVKGIVAQIKDEEAIVYLGGPQGTIRLENMDWARQPNPKLDGKYHQITYPREALSKGDIIEVKVLSALDGGGWDLALEQEPEAEAGLISIEPGTGYIKAMVGGYDFKKSQFNRATQAVRQPGSAFKPIIFATAIQDGYTPASIIIDSPVIFKEKEDTFDKWKPVNFEKKFYGPTSVRTALSHSRNVVTIKLLQNTGVPKAIQMARRLGITTDMSNNLSIALGSSGVTLYELVSAYSIFANQGVRIAPVPIRIIKDRNDEILFTYEPMGEPVLSPGVAYTITSMMESVVRHGTAHVITETLHRPIAGKTGTTNDYNDAWFIGFSPELVTGVWVGKDMDESLGVNETGTRTAIPIWTQFMEEALKNLPVKSFPIPNDVTYIKINPETGQETDFDDPNGRFEVFLNENLPDGSGVGVNSLWEDTF